MIIGLPLFGQSFIYSYIDPCTKESKFINADMSAPIVIAYYGQVEMFTYEQLYNGTFDLWMNNIYNQYKDNSPCQGAVAITTTTNSTNQISNIITNVQSLLNIDFSGLGGISVNVGGTTSAGSNNVSTNNPADIISQKAVGITSIKVSTRTTSTRSKGNLISQSFALLVAF